MQEAPTIALDVEEVHAARCELRAAGGSARVRRPHLRLLHGAEERDTVLAPYLNAALEAGDKCVCIVEEADRPSLLSGIEAAGGDVDVDGSIASGQLELASAATSYLAGGSFSTEETMQFWRDHLDASIIADGFDFARNAGDTTGLVGLIDDFSYFATYESELNRLTGEYPQTLLCLYDLRHFAGIGVVDLLRTHLGGLVIENPHYLSPDEYLTTRPDRFHGWAGLTSAERQVAELVAQGHTNAGIADRLALSHAIVDRHLHRIFRKLELMSRGDVARVVPKRRTSE